MLSDDKNIKFAVLKFEKAILVQVLDVRRFKAYFYKSKNSIKIIEFSITSLTEISSNWVIIGKNNIQVMVYPNNTLRDSAFIEIVDMFKSISERN